MIKTAEEFQEATYEQQAEYIQSMMRQIKYDENGQPTNLISRLYESTVKSQILQPIWNWYNNFYFIKPKPKYVPYKIAKKGWRLKGVISKTTGNIYTITAISIDSKACVLINNNWWSLKDMFKHYTWEDGTPFGELMQ